MKDLYFNKFKKKILIGIIGVVMIVVCILTYIFTELLSDTYEISMAALNSFPNLHIPVPSLTATDISNAEDVSEAEVSEYETDSDDIFTENETVSTTSISDTAQESSAAYEDTSVSSEDASVSKNAYASLTDLLQTAIKPVGTTMYVWGGGWNEEDTGAGVEALSFGVSPQWAAFAAVQTADYDYNTTRYQIHDGLDCSGYMGWIMYNIFGTQFSSTGYVMKASTMTGVFSDYGWGSFLSQGASRTRKPGDICSMNGHVWLSLGTCDDGSVLLVHSSPPGVRICGTLLSDGSTSQAVRLAEYCMSNYYPDWYSRYPDCSVSYNYLSGSSVMRWDTDILSNDYNIQNMSANEVVEFLY
jgi:cell wall-associated NlpC family hydrolase